MLNANQCIIGHGGRVREREWRGLNGAVERAPDVDDADARFQQLGGFGGEMMMYARNGTGVGLIDVYAIDGVAVAGGAADGVVEEEDAFGAGDVLQEEGFDFGVVVLLDGFVGSEVFLG